MRKQPLLSNYLRGSGHSGGVLCLILERIPITASYDEAAARYGAIREGLSAGFRNAAHAAQVVPPWGDVDPAVIYGRWMPRSGIMEVVYRREVAENVYLGVVTQASCPHCDADLQRTDRCDGCVFHGDQESYDIRTVGTGANAVMACPLCARLFRPNWESVRASVHDSVYAAVSDADDAYGSRYECNEDIARHVGDAFSAYYGGNELQLFVALDDADMGNDRCLGVVDAQCWRLIDGELANPRLGTIASVVANVSEGLLEVVVSCDRGCATFSVRSGSTDKDGPLPYITYPMHPLYVRPTATAGLYRWIDAWGDDATAHAREATDAVNLSALLDTVLGDIYRNHTFYERTDPTVWGAANVIRTALMDCIHPH